MKYFFIISFCVLMVNLFTPQFIKSQYSLNESFEGPDFPPAGWSTYNDLQNGSEWKLSRRATKIGSGCTVSNFSNTYSKNYLISKRFIPLEGDSLVFYFKQTFYNVYKDSLDVLISNTDSLYSSMNTLLKHFHEGFNYPAYNIYSRVAISLGNYVNQSVWIAFRHSNLNGDNVRIDEVRAGKPVLYEVGIENNNYPSGNVGMCEYPYIVPNISIKNFGQNNINTPFNITYEITGPVNFISIKSDTISSGLSKAVYFDTLYNVNAEGDYNIRIFSSLSNDQNRSNDTIYSQFRIVQSNYEYNPIQNGNYSFSNSALCSEGALSNPEFCWKDTTGNHSLITNGLICSSGNFSGNTDAGYFSLGPAELNGKKIKFGNEVYDSVYIAINGLISFRKSDLILSDSLSDFYAMINQSVPFIAPLWMNFDFGNNRVNINRLSYKVLNRQIIITYDNAPLKNGNENDFVSFQISIEAYSGIRDNSKILFQYDYAKSGTGFIEKYVRRELPDHLTGIRNVDNRSFLYYRKFVNGIEDYTGTLLRHSLAVEFGTDPHNLDSRCSVVNLSAFVEALPTTTDTVTLSISYVDKPLKIIESKKIFLSEGTGTGIFTLPETISNYYLILEHRNSIKVWSKAGNQIFENHELTYDFTADSTAAYGNNLKVISGKAYLYSGDINQDGIIEGSDLSIIENHIMNFPEGIYNTDLNGDGITDGEDLIFADNNIHLNVVIKIPE